jgi:hypothetical protein
MQGGREIANTFFSAINLTFMEEVKEKDSEHACLSNGAC